MCYEQARDSPSPYPRTQRRLESSSAPAAPDHGAAFSCHGTRHHGQRLLEGAAPDYPLWQWRATGQPQAGLTALDWEWADEHGLAGIDLAHGLRQEAYLVKRLPAKQAVNWMLDQASKAPWASYLQRSGWSGAAEDWLRLGLLHSHFHAKNPSEELLREMGIEGRKAES